MRSWLSGFFWPNGNFQLNFSQPKNILAYTFLFSVTEMHTAHPVVQSTCLAPCLEDWNVIFLMHFLRKRWIPESHSALCHQREYPALLIPASVASGETKSRHILVLQMLYLHLNQAFGTFQTFLFLARKKLFPCPALCLRTKFVCWTSLVEHQHSSPTFVGKHHGSAFGERLKTHARFKAAWMTRKKRNLQETLLCSPPVIRGQILKRAKHATKTWSNLFVWSNLSKNRSENQKPPSWTWTICHSVRGAQVHWCGVHGAKQSSWVWFIHRGVGVKVKIFKMRRRAPILRNNCLLET